jgi:hypothetical protein
MESYIWSIHIAAVYSFGLKINHAQKVHKILCLKLGSITYFELKGISH